MNTTIARKIKKLKQKIENHDLLSFEQKMHYKQKIKNAVHNLIAAEAIVNSDFESSEFWKECGFQI